MRALVAAILLLSLPASAGGNWLGPGIVIFGGGSGGGGLDTSAGDARYLMLDASNDPITGELTLQAVSITCTAAASCSIGSSGFEFANVWTDQVSSSSGIVIVDGELEPDTNNVHSLGSSLKKWSTVWATNVGASGGAVSNVWTDAVGRGSGRINWNAAGMDFSGTDFTLRQQGDTAYQIRVYKLGATEQIYLDGDVYSLNDTVNCFSAGGCDLGQSALEWGTLWVNTIDDSDGEVDLPEGTSLRLLSPGGTNTRIYFEDSAATGVGAAQIGTSGTGYLYLRGGAGYYVLVDDHLMPNTSNSFDLGGSSLVWSTLWVNTIEGGGDIVKMGAGASLQLGDNTSNNRDLAFISDPDTGLEYEGVAHFSLRAQNQKVASVRLTEFVINDDSATSTDFRAETDLDANAFLVDSDAELVKFGVNAEPDVASTLALGASALEFGTLWVNTIDDSDDGITIGADTVTIGDSGDQKTLSFPGLGDILITRNGQNKLRFGANITDVYGTSLELQGTDLTCSTDAGCDIGASATELGTAWLQIIDDSDGEVDVDAALDVNGSYITVGTGTSAATVGSSGAYDLQIRTNGTDRIIVDGAGTDVEFAVAPRLNVTNYVDPTPAALPTCGATEVGTLIFVQDTDAAAAEGSLCLCRKDGGAATYAWESLNGASC